MKPPRIAVVIAHAGRGMAGPLRDVKLAAALRALGATVCLFRLQPDPGTERLVLEGDVPAVLCGADNPAEIPHRQVAAALRAEVAAFAPEVLLCKGLGYRVNADLLAALPAATRLVLAIGGGVTDPVVARAEAVLAEYAEQGARHFPALAEAGRVLVLPKHLDLARLGPGIPVAAEEAAFDIANVGNFVEPRKNQAALLGLAARHRVVCIGDGPLLAGLRAAAPAGARLTLPGRLPHPQVFAHLRRSRIMVHPATAEGLPRAMVEAMGCGLPVLAAREVILGGIPPEAGLLVPMAALEDAAEALLADDARRLAMGRAARAHAEATHGPAGLAACAAALLRLLAA
ncbi:glycosyltransferase [Falsiroseomonas selenitidurans]|uniref:Glycosyltransferase family 4 protein n=1 Tax=Falsiroseomonas selenitidurans TaxID=2716335 RepID=A0ABX1E767_9PROT|nr:glycosyltransferase [Falsiroseomonas selenitidurans]NKC31372.1 glycosyltransferase family 4 protein [Falsiroseomonas selenitidurans]